MVVILERCTSEFDAVISLIVAITRISTTSACLKLFKRSLDPARRRFSLDQLRRVDSDFLCTGEVTVRARSKPWPRPFAVGYRYPLQGFRIGHTILEDSRDTHLKRYSLDGSLSACSPLTWVETKPIADLSLVCMDLDRIECHGTTVKRQSL